MCGTFGYVHSWNLEFGYKIALCSVGKSDTAMSASKEPSYMCIIYVGVNDYMQSYYKIVHVFRKTS